MKTTLKTLIIFLAFFVQMQKGLGQNTITKEVSQLISKKRAYNKENGYTYTIQLYNGSEKKAKNIKNKFSKIYYWVKTKIEYDAPDWKIFVGQYQTKLEADRALNKYRDKFTSAIIVKNN